MKVELNKKSGLLVHSVFEGESVTCDIFEGICKAGVFTAKEGEVYVNSSQGAIFVGLGNKDKICLNKIRTAYFNLAKELVKWNIQEVQLDVPQTELCSRSVVNAITEGLLQSEYKFDKFKSKKSEPKDLTVNIISDYEGAKDAIDEAKMLIDSIFLVRDLINLPSNYIYPETLANKAVEILTPLGVKVTVYDEKQMQEKGMLASYSVGKGSENQPRFIVMEYLNDKESEERLGLVGKGITYDSGGYSIKPSDSMKTMFDDMSGAATVIGTLHAIATAKLKTNVVGCIAACENAVSGHSYKPGDIVGSLSGKTIEIDNTDAEGRVTLADSVYYTATELKATKLIDLATLTGACLVALGELYTGAVTNDQKFLDEVIASAKKSGERIWQLPTHPLLGKYNESRVADIKNSGGRFAGTITAGMFIGEFVNNVSWVHLDIAGTAYLSSAYEYLPLGATGVHVKTLFNLVKQR